MPAGRPTKLTKELIEKAWTYIKPVDLINDKTVWQIMGDVVPTIEGLCLYIGISRDTAYQWEKDNKVFSDIMDELRKEQARLLINGALGNKFNSTISKLLLSSKHGYIEKSEQDLTSGGEKFDPVIIYRPEKLPEE